MKKKEFLEELESHLVGLDKEDVKEIIEDYEEHFKIGKKKKRKESEICKSLGDPRQIAKEARKELNKKEESPLKDQAIEVWIEIKKFSKRVFERFKEGMENLSNKVRQKRDNKRKKPNKEKIKKKTSRNSFWKIFGLVCFNLFIFIFIWISLFATLIALMISGVAIIVSGVIIVAFSIFALISYNNEFTKSILFSLLFSGIGITIFGNLFTVLFSKITALFFIGTRKYIKLNSRMIKR